MKILFVLIAFVLTGCASDKSDSMKIRLTISENAKTRCGTHEGCAVIGKNSCEIIAPAPKDHLDHWRMEIMGHELWHCFNGKVHL